MWIELAVLFTGWMPSVMPKLVVVVVFDMPSSSGNTFMGIGADVPMTYQNHCIIALKTDILNH